MSEQFYSIQGEGVTTGTLAVFLRLQGCNLLCEGKKWRCDTIEVWQKGQPLTCEDIVAVWDQKGWLDALKAGAHLVITGGEPLLQQAELILFLKMLDTQCQQPCYVEIETNATILPQQALCDRVNQWNVSPKLLNAGMTLGRVFKQDCLAAFSQLETAFFKFVVTCENDVKDVLDRYVTPFSLVCDRVMVMPAVDSRRGFYSAYRDCQLWAKRYGLTMSGRLQLQIWDQTTGV
ncbi:MAG: 7-carboxy-7-deazaguanine synthase QueE [bacterium]